MDKEAKKPAEADITANTDSLALQWELTAEAAAPFRKTGSAALKPGEPLHIRTHLPACTLRSASAQLLLPMGEAEKSFWNGYQSWTYCPEYGPKDKIRGLHGLPSLLINQYRLDRYSDYHFASYPNKPGVTHGFSYGYLRSGEHFRLIASLDEVPGYTMLQYDAATGMLTLSRDCKGLKVDGDYAVLDLFYAEGTENEVFDAWFAALGLSAKATPPLTGYSSWYNRYEAISEDAIRTDLAGCKALLQAGDLFQIDDGWEPAVGDWLETDKKKFPNGLAPLVKDIHAAGFAAGLWLAPFVCRKGSALQKQHPDWLLQVNGKPWSCGSNWGGFYSLDIDNPAVIDYLRRVFQQVLGDWGFDLVKLDFLYGAAPFGTEKETRAARMTRAMDLLRELCGDKKILGCGVPVMPAFGRVDYCRIGCDVGLDWDDKPYMRIIHRERVSTKQSLSNTIYRRELDGRAWRNDPDVFFLRTENLQLSDADKKLLAETDCLLGGVLLTSDDPGSYTAEQKAHFAALRHLRDEAKNVRIDYSGAQPMLRWQLDGAEWERPLWPEHAGEPAPKPKRKPAAKK